MIGNQYSGMRMMMGKQHAEMMQAGGVDQRVTHEQEFPWASVKKNILTIINYLLFLTQIFKDDLNKYLTSITILQ